MRMCKSNHENELTHIIVSKLMLFGIFRVCKEIKFKPKFTKMRSDLCRYFLVQCFNHFTGRARLIRSHSSARFCFELSGNSN